MFLDTFFIFIIILLIYRGYRQGFSQMLITFGVFVLSVIVSLTAFSKIGDSVLKTKNASKMHESISETITKQIEKFDDRDIENAPYISSLSKFSSHKGDEIIELSSLSDTISENALASAITLPIGIVIFILLRLAIYALRVVVRKTTSVPVVHGLDCILGASCGLLMSILVIGVMFFFLSYAQFIPSLGFLKGQFDTSGIVLLINDFIF